MRNFWFLEVKAETEKPERGWYGVRGLEKWKELRREKTGSAVWGESSLLFWAPSVLSEDVMLGLVPGLFLMASRWFQWFQTSLPHYNCVQIQEYKKVSGFLIRGENLVQKPQYTFLMVIYIHTFKSIYKCNEND